MEVFMTVTGTGAAEGSPSVNVEVTTPQKKSDKGDSFADIIDALGRNREFIVDITKQIAGHIQSQTETDTRLTRETSAIVAFIMVLIIAGSIFLVWIGRMSDGALTFLFGVILGYLLQFVNRLEFGGGGNGE